MARLKTTYNKEIVSKLMSKLSLKNKHDVPKISKIILNMGLGEDASDGKKLKACTDDMSLIAGQKPVVTKFKKSISNFKTRKGSNAGIKVTYEKEIISKLMGKLSLKNKHDVPKVEKIILNMGLGEDGLDGKKLKACIDDMALISGQKPIITKFKKSISNFKTRKGSNAGVKVTLRAQKMYEFIDRLVNIALPRIKDFRGLSSKGIDNSNNYSFGIKEHIVFPEVNFDKVDKIRGLDVTIVTSSKNKQGTLELLKEFNFPLIEKKN